MVINANEVKKRGVAIFDELFKDVDEVIIAKRGKKRYVVVDYDDYKEFRAYKLDKAYKEIMQDYENGDYRVVSAKDHIEEVLKDLDVQTNRD